jgi:hypothetical protein
VWASWLPIAAGHAASTAIVLFAVVVFGLFLDHSTLSRSGAVILLGWAIWHTCFGHRRRLRVGMQTGLVGLALWSFLMSTAHGAGLMLIPLVRPLCLSGSPAGSLTASNSIPVAMAALAVHTAAMLAAIATVSVIVYEWAGLAFLRSGWINFDLIWVAALGACGALLMLG